MIEYQDSSTPGELEHAWADYQIAAAKRDAIEAAAELVQGNVGNAWALATRAARYVRFAFANREQAERKRILALHEGNNGAGD